MLDSDKAILTQKQILLWLVLYVDTETKIKLLFIEAGLMLAQRQNLSLFLEVYLMLV